ncbi:MAG: hypothetical protein B6I36_02215 [Desulfobacteraceae bacterium 4572_35.1]|nr:MAG: hypothetical protein B6I36_02215 [Desulfobacteraceae bacterium 4572_35.1]
MNDVFEFLIDGTSGLAPGGVEGACIVTGVCSVGTVGKGYLLGKSSDLEALLGVGPLVDRLRDLFAAGGQAPIAIAVPVAGLAGAYVSAVTQTGTGPLATSSGVVAESADVIVRIASDGAAGTAKYELSENGGANFAEAIVVPVNGQITLGSTGITLTLAEGSLVAADEYALLIRNEIGPVVKIGTGPDISTAGTPLAAAEVALRITAGGGHNVGTYQISVDGDNFGPIRTIPVDGLIAVGSTGVTITVPDQEMVLGDSYTFNVLAPVPSISAVLTTIEQPLSLYDVEFVYVVGASDSADWAAMGAKADVLWNLHRPTFFICESRLPYANETLDDWAAALIADKQGFAHRFVSCVTAHGEVSDSTGKRLVRNWAGLFSGRLLSIPVMRAPGRVRDGGISQGSLPDLYTEGHQSQLESNGYVTAKHYAGLSSAYWGDEKTLADVTSDYQYLTVLRTVFKAVRKARIAALKSMYDEAGDPVAEGGAAGLNYLKANIETALNTMVAAVPCELAAGLANIPNGQDIVNNGVAVELDLIGIPIIRKIKLFARYIYAGSGFDPRLQG